MKKEYVEKNPQKVLGDVYNIILDRRENPKEGSYTNLLLEKGLDNILKKVGEENTEIIIAAKNTDHEHLKYEISDYIYHLMVLMAEKDITWKRSHRNFHRENKTTGLSRQAEGTCHGSRDRCPHGLTRFHACSGAECRCGMDLRSAITCFCAAICFLS